MFMYQSFIRNILHGILSVDSAVYFQCSGGRSGCIRVVLYIVGRNQGPRPTLGLRDVVSPDREAGENSS